MKFTGFIGPAYTLKSVSVDAQRCINLYPEKIESGNGKEGSIAYLKSTPGLELLLTVGAGPIRLTHVDSIGRILVVSGNKLYRVARRADWKISVANFTSSALIAQGTKVDTTNDLCDSVTSHGFITGIKVRVTSTSGLPAPLIAATDYWVISITSTTFQFASTLANAQAGTFINLTTTGTGDMTVAGQGGATPLQNIDFDGDISISADVFTKTAHALYQAQQVRITTLGTPMPGGISRNTNYYVIVVTANTFKLATSVTNAIAGTAIDITVLAGAWAATLLYGTEHAPVAEATLTTSSGPIRAASMSLAGNGVDSTTIFTDGLNNYLFSDTADPALANGAIFEYAVGSGGSLIIGEFISSHITWIDGYFLLNEVGTNKFWTSDLKSIVINGLSFASSEGSPDLVMGLIANQRYLWVFNEKTTEVYANTGNADFPFERVGGGFVEMGCLAKHSIAKIDNTVFWLGRSEDGSGAVYAAKGITPERISTHAIEYAISTYASPSSATSYTYHDQGHNFFVLNFTEATWVFDLSTGLWHQRAYTTGAGALERQRGEVHAFDSASGLHLIGDRTSGKLYFYNNNYFKDDTDLITRLRASPHISSGLKRVFCSSFQLDMEVGVGLVSGQGSDPTVMLDFSNDGGNTWSSEAYALADAGSGQIGDFKKRVIWRRLGSFRDRIFRIKITDPVKVTLIGAEINVTEGQS